ncbi:MAG: branched-chain amino acid transport system permease protein [Acidimicrobiaceae bacterium]|jgi:branched-subunit amino acid ABC-type transport system permease component|nr:branched-chain amino acid transport system permease protein [Acidimicrobiaceae bacterium]MDQ1444653.1 branched-chain amino acid transport system permease protein [Acidimicrobiaceae bacterium]
MTTILRFMLLSLPNVAAYAIFAIGIVVIFRASKVLNVAHGAMAMVPAYLVYAMSKAGVPIAIAFALGVASGGLLGLAVERVFVRPLRHVSVTAQTVGTVAALGLMVALSGKIWGTGTQLAPSVFPDKAMHVGSASLRTGQLGLFLVMLVVAGGLTALLQFTDVGLAMRGAADNRRAASLMGVDPDIAISGAWILGGATAAIAGILLAAVTNLNPLTLSLQAIPAFVAALIGGLGSLYGAIIGAAVVGGATGLVPAFAVLQRVQGMQQLLLGFVALAVMAMRGERYVASDVRSGL